MTLSHAEEGSTGFQGGYSATIQVSNAPTIYDLSDDSVAVGLCRDGRYFGVAEVFGSPTAVGVNYGLGRGASLPPFPGPKAFEGGRTHTDVWGFNVYEAPGVIADAAEDFVDSIENSIYDLYGVPR